MAEPPDGRPCRAGSIVRRPAPPAVHDADGDQPCTNRIFRSGGKFRPWHLSSQPWASHHGDDLIDGGEKSGVRRPPLLAPDWLRLSIANSSSAVARAWSPAHPRGRTAVTHLPRVGQCRAFEGFEMGRIMAMAHGASMMGKRSRTMEDRGERRRPLYLFLVCRSCFNAWWRKNLRWRGWFGNKLVSLASSSFRTLTHHGE